MVSELEILAIAVVSVLGAVVSATLGWLESEESFDMRKYSASLIRAVFAGLVNAFGFSTVQQIDMWMYIVAFLGGAGIDVLGHRASETMRARLSE